MKRNNISTYAKLESYYIQKLVDIVVKEQSKIIVWEEVFNNNVSIPLDTIVQVWLSPFYDTLEMVSILLVLYAYLRSTYRYHININITYKIEKWNLLSESN